MITNSENKIYHVFTDNEEYDTYTEYYRSYETMPNLIDIVESEGVYRARLYVTCRDGSLSWIKSASNKNMVSDHYIFDYDTIEIVYEKESRADNKSHFTHSLGYRI